MLASSIRRRLLGLLALATISCARNPAPYGWLPTPARADTDPYGAWVVGSLRGVPDSSIAGELLAVERDSVFVLTPDSVVRTTPLDSVSTAHVAFYDAQSSQLALWTALGAVSTISNGVFLLFTFPAFVIGGSIATAKQSQAPIRSVEDRAAWDAVRMYARFPTGLPPGLPTRLAPKPDR